MKKILLINKDDKLTNEVVEQVVSEFGKYGVETVFEDSPNKDDIELTVVVGGDGSILRSRFNFPNHVPILGINTGSVGYLSEIQPPRIPDAVERIMKKDYQLELLTQIQASVGNWKSELALNDFTIYPVMATTMIRVNVYINGAFISEVQADALLVSTPTGSTAYSMSARGSVLTNDSNALIITAVAPYKPFAPIVVNDDSVIEIEVNRNYTECFIKTDGMIEWFVEPHHKIKIVKKKPKPFIRLGYISFYEKLRGRLR